MLHPNGSVFTAEEIAAVTTTLKSMSTAERQEYLRQNAAAVSASPLEHLLIVSGPGTGKSILFADRIEYWGSKYEGVILVTTFVKKLAVDLSLHLLSSSSKLSEERKASVVPQTLHALARSILEKSMPWNGFRKRVHVVPNDEWDQLIWNDAASNGTEREAWREFDQQRARATDPLLTSVGSTVATYRQLCRYYNAASFSEMILLAQQALQANPELFTCDCVIVDELQDFNKLERCLLETILRNAHSWLMAGDDDQVLYDELKQSTRDLIVDMYNDQSVAKAMLPLCTRCDNHIVHAAAAFMQQCRVGDGQCIEKAFIPARTEPSSRVHMVCCSTASSTFEYLKVYLEGIAHKLQDRLSALSRNDPEITDPYLLILTPNKTCRMLGKGGRDQLMQLISPYKASTKIHTESYYTIQECLTWEQNPNDNWLCRRVLAWCKSIDESSGRAAAQESFAKKIPLSTCERECMARARDTCGKLRSLIEDHDLDARSKAKSMADLVWIEDVEGLAEEIESGNLNPEISPDSAYSDEMAASERNDPTALSAAELLTITGSKGLNADEVVILGFDQLNMKPIRERAMYVALTRARHNLTLITTLSGGASSLPHYFDMLPESDLEFSKFAKTAGGLKPLSTRQAYRRYIDLISGHR